MVKLLSITIHYRKVLNRLTSIVEDLFQLEIVEAGDMNSTLALLVDIVVLQFNPFATVEVGKLNYQDQMVNDCQYHGLQHMIRSFVF
jgi:hypothetical protein